MPPDSHTGREAPWISLGQRLQQQADHFAAYPFVSQAETGQTPIDAESNRLTNQNAPGLLDLNIGAGDYVGIMLAQSIPYLAGSYALKKSGAVEVAINSAFRGVSLARMISLTRCKTLIMADRFEMPRTMGCRYWKSWLGCPAPQPAIWPKPN